MQQARVVITRANFGCGSSREHAVWVFEVNNINIVIAESFARIFRQNMFNCGTLAVELPPVDIEHLFAMKGQLNVSVDLDTTTMTASSSDPAQAPFSCSFQLNPFDRDLVAAGGWLAYADKKF
jgi:3-isopropylmalate/(R)-2-methylmalate dehydratase small subunit